MAAINYPLQKVNNARKEAMLIMARVFYRIPAYEAVRKRYRDLEYMLPRRFLVELMT